MPPVYQSVQKRRFADIGFSRKCYFRSIRGRVLVGQVRAGNKRYFHGLAHKFNKVSAGLQVLFNPAEALLEILHGVGIGEPQEAFPIFSKVNTRGNSNMGLFQDIKSQIVGV